MARHALIERLLSDLGWPLLADAEAVRDFTARPGAHVLFAPGDPARNLETADVAVILPELRAAFQGLFDCAVLDDTVEAEVREETRVLKTPGLIFYRDGQFVGGIAKVRDWDDYMTRIARILGTPIAAE